MKLSYAISAVFGDTADTPGLTTTEQVPDAIVANVQSTSTSSISTISKVKMAMSERGQKLNAVEDNTEQMANNAKQFASLNDALLQKYKPKK